MSLDEKIAEITLEPKTKRIITLEVRGGNLRFRCQQCAVFCCKLGGPKLLRNDIERLKQSGQNPHAFLNPEEASLNSTKDGSCIFLSFTAQRGLYQCSVYEHRPAFCRLYPFQFERLGPQSYALKFIPCCNGLNTENGEPVDEKFFVKFLQEILFELIDSDAI